MPLIVKVLCLEEENTKWYQLTQIDKKTIVKTAIVVVVVLVVVVVMVVVVVVIVAAVTVTVILAVCYCGVETVFPC